MAIDVVITQRGLLKKPLTEQHLSPAGLRVGHWNPAGVLDEGPEQGWRVVCDPAQPGRGCEIEAAPGEKERAGLRQPLPCTGRDLELFYGLVETICRVWKTDRFTQDGAERRLKDISQLKQEQKQAGAGLLRAMARQWREDGMGLITGAVYPIYMEEETIPWMEQGDQEAFAQYLTGKQTVDCYYAKPSFYRHSNGKDILGVYTITEGVDSILPPEPFVPPLYRLTYQGFDVTTQQVTDWQVALVRVWEENGEMKGDTAARLPFREFARRARLDQRPRFDAQHVRVKIDALSEVLE